MGRAPAWWRRRAGAQGGLGVELDLREDLLPELRPEVVGDRRGDEARVDHFEDVLGFEIVGRDAEWADMGANTLGAVTGLGLGFLLLQAARLVDAKRAD